MDYHSQSKEELISRIKELEQQSDRKFKMIFESSGTSNSIFDRNYCLILQNSNSRKELGKLKDEAIGLSVYELFGNETGIKVAERMNRIFQSGVSEIHETSFELPGGIKWFRSSYQPVKDEHENFYAIQIISQDITQLKQSQLELEESRNHFQSLVENIPQRIFIKDLNSVYITCNEIYARDLGITPGQIVGKDDFAFHPTNLANAYRRDDQEVILTGKTKMISEQYVSKGQEYWIRIHKTPYRNKYGEIIGVLGIFEDISESRRIEEQLLESENKYRAIFENLQDVYYETALDGTILEISPSIASLSNGQFSREELLGRSINDFYTDKTDRERVLQALKSQNSIKDFEVNFLNKDNAYYTCSISAGLYFGEDGRPEKIIGTLRNITQRKLAETKLKESQTQLKSVIDSTSDMIWSVDAEHFGLLNWNHAFEEYFLNDRGKKIAVGETPEVMFPEGSSYIGYWIELFNRTKNEGTVTIEYESFSHTRILLLSLNRLEQEGKVFGISVFAKNITAQRSAEVALRKSEDQFRNIFNNLQDAFFQADEQGVFTLVSPSAARMYGYNSINEIIGMPAANLYADAQERNKLFAALVVNGSVEDFITMGKRKDGTPFWVSMNVKLQYNSEGKILGSVGVVRDISERMRAEGEIMQVKRRFETMFDQAPVGITLSNSLGHELLEVNNKFAEIVGRTIEGVKNIGWMQITHPDDLQEDIDNMKRLNAGEVNGFQMKKRYIRGDGSPVWVNMTVAKINAEDASLPQNLCMVEDITDRIIAENALRKSEDRFREVTENSLDAAYKRNLQTNTYDYLSPVFYRIGGYSQDEINSLPNKDVMEIMHPDDLAEINRVITQALSDSTGNAFQVEYRFKHKGDGKYRWFYDKFTVMRDESGKPVAMIGSVSDITERKRIQEAHRDSEERLRLATNAGNIGVWDWDIVKDELIWDSSMYSLYNINPEDFSGAYDAWLKTLHPDDLMRAEAEISSAVLGGHGYSHEFRIIRKDGSVRFIKAESQIFCDSEGNSQRMIGVNIDITAQKESEMELIAAKEKAEESDRLKTAFLTNMSHEIRTPMNGIIGFSNLLIEPGLTGEDQQEYITLIQKSGKRMLNILHEIVDISKIESGLMQVKFDETNIDEQFEYIYKLLKPDAQNKGISLAYKNALPASESVIKTDREKLFAILVNIVKNAIKYTDQGSVEFGYFTCSQKTGTRFALNLQEHSPSGVFYVKDTGIGIPPDRQQAIFDRFVQADILDVEARQGAGLGLSIAKSYVEMLGGEIWVESKPGLGSTFYFHIANQDEQGEKTVSLGLKYEEESEKQMNAYNSGLNILIVEDDEISAKYLSTIIKKLSKKIMHAPSGDVAVEVCRNNKDIDLVLMDIRMPVMNGYEATRQIRGFNNDVKIIAQTAFGLASDRIKSIEAGCDDYISKPINREEMFALIKLHFKKL